MMVEAGGTENSWELYEEGAPKVTEETIAEGLEEAKRWIGASIDLQTQLREEVERVTRPGRRTSSISRRSTTRPRSSTAVKQHAEADTAEAMKIADKTERNTRLGEIEVQTLVALTGTADAPAATRKRRKRYAARSGRCRRK